MKTKSNTTKKFFKERKEGRKERKVKRKETQSGGSLSFPPALCALSLRLSRLPPCGVLGGGRAGSWGQRPGPPNLKGLWFWRPGWDPRWEDGALMHLGSRFWGFPREGAGTAPAPFPGVPF